MKRFVLLLILPFVCCFAQAQHIKFTQAWVWEYKNELVSENEPGHQGEIAIYFEPKKNYWLFTAEAYGISGEMFDWILGKPDGTYLICTIDEFRKKTITTERLQFPLNKILPKHYQALGKEKIFNQNKLGFPKMKGAAFKVNYTKTNDRSSIFVGDFKANFLPLYFFNRLNIEAKLPFQFPVDFPKNKLLLQETSIINKTKLQLVLKEISYNEYFIDLKTI